MAGKRGRPRKLQVVQRESIASLRGKQLHGEQTLGDSGCASKGLVKGDELGVGCAVEGSGGTGRWGDDSVIPVAGEVEKMSILRPQAPICDESTKEKEGVYLATVRRGLIDSEGPRQEGPRSMIGNRDRQNGMPLSYEEHVREELEITAEDIAPELAFWQDAIIGYVLGDLVPFSAMESFVRRQWSGISMPRIILHEDGYFIFQFGSVEDKD
ncbi:hypothetical protein Dimus_011780 [Dionaea muscipula]